MSLEYVLHTLDPTDLDSEDGGDDEERQRQKHEAAAHAEQLRDCREDHCQVLPLTRQANSPTEKESGERVDDDNED